MSCPYGSRITSAKQAAETARDETRRLKEEVRALKAQQQQMLDAFNRMAGLVEGLANDVRAMKQELYPEVENTKPALKAPGGQP
jgi:uncharacterized membrane-anchored protein YhcB (DUF1043 family)